MTDIIDAIREQCRGDVAHKHQVQMIRLYQLEEARKRVDRARTAAELDMAEDDLRVGREHWAEVEGL